MTPSDYEKQAREAGWDQDRGIIFRVRGEGGLEEAPNWQDAVERDTGKRIMTENENQFDRLPNGNSSPIYFEGGNLYVSAKEWDRLCHERETDPLVRFLQDVHTRLSSGKSVRIIGADGGIDISADRTSEFQRILDNANGRRANLGLAPAIPLI